MRRACMISRFCTLFIKDKYTGWIHRVGSNKHDSLYVDEKGTIHYFNLQNGDGCIGYKSKNNTTLAEKYPDRNWGERSNELVWGYEFVTCDHECEYCSRKKCLYEYEGDFKDE